jgi:hypothetical protein
MVEPERKMRMKKYMTAIAFILAPVLAHARTPDWVRIGESTTSTVYVDQNSIKKRPDGSVAFWDRLDIIPSARKQKVASSMAHMVATCDDAVMARMDGFVATDEFGETLTSNSLVKTQTVNPGSLVSHEIEWACEVASKR